MYTCTRVNHTLDAPTGSGQGQDIDGDGQVDTAQYRGCFFIPDENVSDLRSIPSNTQLTPGVSTLAFWSQQAPIVPA